MTLKDLLKPTPTERGQICLCAQFAFVRNLERMPFPDRMKEADRVRRSAQIIAQLEQLLPGIENLTPTLAEAQAHLAVMLLTAPESRLPGYALLYLDKPEGVDAPIWCEVMGANHLTFSVIATSQQLSPTDYDTLTEQLQRFVDKLEPHFGFARTERFGYLTRQLTLTGSGFRLRVWLHLAGLMHFDHLRELENAATFADLRIDTNNDVGSQPPPGALCILFNGRSLRDNAVDEARALQRFLGSVIRQERNARQRLLLEEPYVLLDIVSRLQANLHATLMVTPDELCDSLSDFYLAWDLAAITPKQRPRLIPPMISALMFDDDHLSHLPLHRLLEGVYLPPPVRDFPPWRKAATRAIWMRTFLDFSISRSFKRRALQ